MSHADARGRQVLNQCWLAPFLPSQAFQDLLLTPRLWQPSLFAQADGPHPDCVRGMGFRTQCAMAGTWCI